MITWEYEGWVKVTTTQKVKDLYDLLTAGLPLARTRARTKALSELFKLKYARICCRTPGCYERIYSEELTNILEKLDEDKQQKR